MTNESERHRETAAADRAAAEASSLPNAKARLLRSADKWDEIADRTELVQAAKKRR